LKGRNATADMANADRNKGDSCRVFASSTDKHQRWDSLGFGTSQSSNTTLSHKGQIEECFQICSQDSDFHGSVWRS